MQLEYEYHFTDNNTTITYSVFDTTLSTLHQQSYRLEHQKNLSLK
jgi:hypothetical protein